LRLAGADCTLAEMRYVCLLALAAGLGMAGEMKIQTQTLKNGLRAVAIYNPGSKSESVFTFLPLGLTSDGPERRNGLIWWSTS